MGCGGSKNTLLNKPVADFLLMINTTPNFKKFLFSAENVKSLTKSSVNPVYGGSVLQKVGELGKKREKANPLDEEIQ